MKRSDVVLLLLLGLVIWIAGTVYYAYRGHAIFETTPARYQIAFIFSPIVSTLLCVAILKWRHIAPAHWTTATLLLAIPGMAGEAIVLTNLSTFMPGLHPATCGRYGAFLFTAYAVALSLAEIVTLRATL